MPATSGFFLWDSMPNSRSRGPGADRGCADDAHGRQPSGRRLNEGSQPGLVVVLSVLTDYVPSFPPSSLPSVSFPRPIDRPLSLSATLARQFRARQIFASKTCGPASRTSWCSASVWVSGPSCSEDRTQTPNPKPLLKSSTRCGPRWSRLEARKAAAPLKKRENLKLQP